MNQKTRTTGRLENGAGKNDHGKSSLSIWVGAGPPPPAPVSSPHPRPPCLRSETATESRAVTPLRIRPNDAGARGEPALPGVGTSNPQPSGAVSPKPPRPPPSMPPTCILPIKAVPNAARTEVVGWLGEALKVRVKAPPVDGKANAELCRFMAGELKLPKSAVSIHGGATTRQKRLEIHGVSITALRERFPL